MKTASPELIALLAGARQFVMWETFSFTLADGSQLTYSTVDPDDVHVAAAPPPPPPPPPPLQDLWLQDTFAGTGTLATHVGEVGATWSTFYGSSPASFLLTGTGGVYLAEYDRGLEIQCTGKPADGTADVAIEFGFSLASGAIWPEAGVYTYKAGNGNNRFGATLYMSETATVRAVAFVWVPVEGQISVDVDTGIVPGSGVHTVRAALTQGRTTVSLYVDGVLLGAMATSGEALTAADVTLLYAYTPADDVGFIVSDLRGGLV